MSIYALPGPLFKLVSSGISPAPKSKDVVEVVPTSNKDSSSVGSQTSSLKVSDSAENPLRRRPSTGSASPSSSLHHSNVCDHSNANTCNSRNHNTCNSNTNVVIAVKEAKIDPQRLIRSLSQSGINDSKVSGGGKTKASGDSNEEDTPSSNSTPPAPRRRRSMQNDMGIKSQGDSNDNVCKCDPHEEAIKFEFSVSFNGREYTATRTLPRILQFRVDLIEEFRARRMWRERRRKRKQSVPPPMAKVTDLSDDEDEEDETIPELPRLSEDAAGSSGFTMLNALLRPYGPALEHWLRKVIDIVPHDSQCLTQFLWEPISGNAAPSSPTKKFERRRSSSTLIAIQEKDSEDMEELEQYDSDTDEYLLIH